MRAIKRTGSVISLSILLGFAAHAAPQPNNNPNGNAQPKAFFVATNGNDSWSGGLPVPNRNRTDGPLASIKKAVELTRAIGGGGQPDAAQTIWLCGGTHFLQEPLHLGSENSGLKIAAWKNEKPLISGGKHISGWRDGEANGKKVWIADLPAVKDGSEFFHQLWVNGQRAIRARHPNAGYLHVESLPDKTPEWTQGQTRFRFKEGDLKSWKTATNGEVIAMTRWVESRLPIRATDEAGRIVSFGKKSVFQLAAGDPYYVENVLEALDEPGEWYLDRSGGQLYYLPRPGEKPETAEVIAPVLTELVRVEPQSGSTQAVQNIRFEGLTFSHDEWYFPEGFAAGKGQPIVSPEPNPEIGGFSQAAIGVPAAITLTRARNCWFTNCTFSHLGSYALQLGRGCKSNVISHCEFFDLGAGGLKLGETAIRDKEEDLAASNSVVDCRIHDGGKLFHSAIGVWIGQSPGNLLNHNLIHDFYYTGISIGWTWGYGVSCASNNIVGFNHVHHIGVLSNGDGPILSDMGGIYTLGKQPGTRIVNNLWHDVAGIQYGGWGIYTDEGSSGILIENNLVYNTTHGGFHQHYGETNVVVNNIFAFARDHQIQRSRAEPHLSFTFATNIVYLDHGKLLEGTWADDKFSMDYNVFWDERRATNTANTISFFGASLEKWRERGHDAHSVIVDPLFVAPHSNDFRLRAGSPALRVGFHELDIRGVGPRL
jgi:parallel beta-helix repeat protein